MMTHRGIIPLVVLCAAVARGAGAQQVTCPQDPDDKPNAAACTLPRRGGDEPIRLKVLGPDGKPAQGAEVTFNPPAGGVINEHVVCTDKEGIAQDVWEPLMLGDEESVDIEVVVSNKKDNWSVKKHVILGPRPKVSGFAIDPTSLDGNNQSWYVGRQLLNPVTVAVTPAKGADASTCRKGVVVFKALGDAATSSPDSVRMTREGDHCVARSQWKLGGTTGEQYMRAWIAGEPQKETTFTATARNTPWLAAGLVWRTYDWYSYTGVKPTTKTFQVVTKSPTVDSTTTVTKTTTDTVRDSPRGGFSATLGINTPIFTRWQKVRMSLSADVQHIDTDWFVGFSIPQIYDGVKTEDIGADLHLVVHLGRRDVLEHPDQCKPDGGDCGTKPKFRALGIGLSLQLNATNALTAFAGLFPK